MTSPSTEARGIIIAALNAEFAPEGIVFASDKLHPSLGWQGPVGGVYPDIEETRTGRPKIELWTACYIQLYAKWEKEIDPTQAVDPGLIEGYAARLRAALKPVRNPHTPTTWTFTVDSISYMDDPTGNRSRLLARVVGVGGNSNLVETGP